MLPLGTKKTRCRFATQPVILSPLPAHRAASPPPHPAALALSLSGLARPGGPTSARCARQLLLCSPPCVPRHAAALQLGDRIVPRINPILTIALHRHSLHLRGPTASTQPHSSHSTHTAEREQRSRETNAILLGGENRLAAQRHVSFSLLEK